MTGGVIATQLPAAVSSLSAFSPQSDAGFAKGTPVTAYIQDSLTIASDKLATKIGKGQGSGLPAVSIPGVLTNEVIVAMVQAGMTDDQIIAKIKSSTTSFRLDPSDLLVLKKAHVSSAVIQVMIDVSHPHP
jgi:hypothetical protein